MQQLIPDSISLGSAAVQQVGGKGLQGRGGVFRSQIHGNLANQQGIFSELLDGEAQTVQHILIGQQFSGRGRGEPHGNRRDEALTADALLIGLQLFKENPLVGGVLVN